MKLDAFEENVFNLRSHLNLMWKIRHRAQNHTKTGWFRAETLKHGNYEWIFNVESRLIMILRK